MGQIPLVSLKIGRIAFVIDKPYFVYFLTDLSDMYLEGQKKNDIYISSSSYGYTVSIRFLPIPDKSQFIISYLFIPPTVGPPKRCMFEYFISVAEVACKER